MLEENENEQPRCGSGGGSAKQGKEKEYVLIGFSDGDYRVYDKYDAEQQLKMNEEENVPLLTRTELARNTDRRVLIEMAVLARGARGRNNVDMTDDSDNAEEDEYYPRRRANNVR